MKVSLLLVPCLLLFLALQTTEAWPHLAKKVSESDVCEDMFPEGHELDAQMTSPPYVLMVSKKNYTVGETITVTLKMKDSNDSNYNDFEGMFVQARMAACQVTKPVGTFTLTEATDFLGVVDCHKDRPMSAIAHKKEQHKTSVSFNWTAPSSEPGRIFFRATVAYNKKTFWTNVFSDYLEEDTDASKVPEKHCPVRSKYSSSASPVSAATSLILVAAVLGRLL